MVPKPPIRTRESLHNLQRQYDAGDTEPLEKLVRAFKGIQERDPSDQDSFWVIAGYHGEPFRGPGATGTSSGWWGGFCHHGSVLFPTWHRAYLLRLEDALRSVDRCEDVTLPFWDECYIVLTEKELRAVIEKEKIAPKSVLPETIIKSLLGFLADPVLQLKAVAAIVAEIISSHLLSLSDNLFALIQIKERIPGQQRTQERSHDPREIISGLEQRLNGATKLSDEQFRADRQMLLQSMGECGSKLQQFVEGNKAIIANKSHTDLQQQMDKTREIMLQIIKDIIQRVLVIPEVLTQATFPLDNENIPNPLYSYKFAKNINDRTGDGDYSKPQGYETVRYPLSGLVGPQDIVQTTDHNNNYPDETRNTEILNQNVKSWLDGSIKITTDPTDPDKRVTAYPRHHRRSRQVYMVFGCEKL
ncbi:Tyrosinase [Arthrobotrys entomopaga]|nr:Tyrosinase [Arthrobotrys entomopaga]